MGLFSYLRSIGRGKQANGACLTPAEAAEAAAGKADENEDFFAGNLRRFASVKKRRAKSSSGSADEWADMDWDMFEKAAASAAPVAKAPAAEAAAATVAADGFPEGEEHRKDPLSLEFLKRLKSGKYLGSLSAADVVWSTHMASPEGITKGDAWNMTSGCNPCGGTKPSVSCSAHEDYINKLAPDFEADSTKSFDELLQELNQYIGKFTDSTDDEPAKKISDTGILMCIADILRDFQLIFSSLSPKEQTQLKGILRTQNSILAQIRLMYTDLTTFINSVTAEGGGKRARRVRRTKRTKGKSRGRAGKATRVRRNNNNSNNNAKTKRNKGKKRRTKRA